MGNIAEKGSCVLDATADLGDLLRLAHEALHRIKQDVHGDNYNDAELLSLKLHDLHLEADQLSVKINLYVKNTQSQASN